MVRHKRTDKSVTNLNTITVAEFITRCQRHRCSGFRDMPLQVQRYLKEIVPRTKIHQEGKVIFSISPRSSGVQTLGGVSGMDHSDFLSSRVSVSDNDDYCLKYVEIMVQHQLDQVGQTNHARGGHLPVRTFVQANPKKYAEIAGLLKHPNQTQQQAISSWSSEQQYFTSVRNIPTEYPIHILAECYVTSDDGLLERLEHLQTSGFGGNTRIPKHLKTKYKRSEGKVSKQEYDRYTYRKYY
jgi:hypothetical protein